MIQTPPLKIIHTNIWHQLYQLVVADNAVDVISELVVAAGFEVDHPRPELLLQAAKALLCL